MIASLLIPYLLSATVPVEVVKPDLRTCDAREVSRLSDLERDSYDGAVVVGHNLDQCFSYEGKKGIQGLVKLSKDRQGHLLELSPAAERTVPRLRFYNNAGDLLISTRGPVVQFDGKRFPRDECLPQVDLYDLKFQGVDKKDESFIRPDTALVVAYCGEAPEIVNTCFNRRDNLFVNAEDSIHVSRYGELLVDLAFPEAGIRDIVGSCKVQE